MLGNGSHQATRQHTGCRGSHLLVEWVRGACTQCKASGVRKGHNICRGRCMHLPVVAPRLAAHLAASGSCQPPGTPESTAAPQPSLQRSAQTAVAAWASPTRVMQRQQHAGRRRAAHLRSMPDRVPWLEATTCRADWSATALPHSSRRPRWCGSRPGTPVHGQASSRRRRRALPSSTGSAGRSSQQRPGPPCSRLASTPRGSCSPPQRSTWRTRRRTRSTRGGAPWLPPAQAPAHTHCKRGTRGTRQGSTRVRQQERLLQPWPHIE